MCSTFLKVVDKLNNKHMGNFSGKCSNLSIFVYNLNFPFGGMEIYRVDQERNVMS